MEKIDNQQFNTLLKLLENNSVKCEWILNICSIECLTELTVRQYNFLLLLINKIFL